MESRPLAGRPACRCQALRAEIIDPVSTPSPVRTLVRTILTAGGAVPPVGEPAPFVGLLGLLGGRVAGLVAGLVADGLPVDAGGSGWVATGVDRTTTDPGRGCSPIR